MFRGFDRQWQRAAYRVFQRLTPGARQFCTDLVCGSFEEVTYHRVLDRGFRPAGIVDVGAYEGNWTRMTQRIFGPTPALMVEAQPGKRAILEDVMHDWPQARLALCPLSRTAGEEITFYEMGTGSSFLAETSNAARTERELVTRTLDEVVNEALPDIAPLFLKVDVQGAELHVLAGGKQTLDRCELVQLETAMLQYNEGAPLMPEVAGYMADNGFLPIEVSGFSRPGAVLVQIDLLFARAGSSLRPGSFTF
jgi:FkbM family methyltransferase